MGKINVTLGNNFNSATDELVHYHSIDITGNAEPTSRLLSGSYDAGYVQEWIAPCMLEDGREGEAVYLFDDEDIVWSDGEPRETEDYPWDEEHLHRIKLIG